MSTTPGKRRTNIVRWLIIGVVGIGLIGGGIWYWMQKKQDSTTLQTDKVTRGNLIQSVTATGQINPVVNVQVGSQISGILQKINVDFNSPVQAGQVLAQLDPSTFQANVSQAEGELMNAQAALQLAQANAARAKDLYSKQAATRAAFDKAVADLNQAEASVQIRSGSLERAKVDLARCTIYSPIDGIVISRNVDVGQTVAASLSAPVLFVIANDLTKMQIDANVAEADIGNIEKDQDVAFSVDAFPTRTFHGKVRQVRNSPITVQNVVSYDVVIDVDNSELKLKPGMTANVSITTAKRENVVQISNAALRVRLPDESTKSASAPAQVGGNGRTGRGGGGGAGGGRGRRERSERTVYTLDENSKPRPVSIKVGISDGVSTEVIEGLKEGDTIITGITISQQQQQPGGSRNPFSGSGRRY